MSPTPSFSRVNRRAFLLLGLFCLGLPGCGTVTRQVHKVVDYGRHVGPVGRYGRLDDEEKAWAKTAWRYFENNTNPDNGLVNGFDRIPIFSMGDVADTLAALAAARDFGLINLLEFDTRLSRILNFLNTMDLFESSVPNRLYNSMTGKMVNEANQPGSIGWSAVDMGRLLTWMKIIGIRYPQYREYLDKAVLRWNFCQVLDDCGTLFGVTSPKGKRERREEGRLGYEQAAAAGFAAWGFNVSPAWEITHLASIDLLGVPVPYDERDPRTTGVPAPVLTMPYVLLGMEYGWRYPGGDGAGEKRLDMEQLASQVFAVQEERYRQLGLLTARTEYQTREPPGTVIDAVFNAGVPWATVGPDGKDQGKLSMVSTRAAFGMWVLWPGDYTDRLFQGIQGLNKPELGWYDGRLEQSGGVLPSVTLTTNAQVLEALLFKVRGRLYPEDAPPAGYFDRRLADAFTPPRGQCLPHERPVCTTKKRLGSKAAR